MRRWPEEQDRMVKEVGMSKKKGERGDDIGNYPSMVNNNPTMVE